MALERIPADIRSDGGVARMSDPEMIAGIQETVSIPVMAKCRIGHFVEAQILQSLDVDFLDESEVLTPADEAHHIDKHAFTIPFVCGATDLGEALRRITEGAAMIRSKGEAGTGNVVEAVRHMRAIRGGIARLAGLPPEELYAAAKDLRAPYELVAQVAADGRLPVVLFSAGGIATPADAALMLQLGAEGVFVGSGIYKSEDPPARARAIVEAATHFRDPEVLARVSRGLRRRCRASRSPRWPRPRCCRGAGGSSRTRRPRVGVLSIQGAFAEHAALLERVGAEPVDVRAPEDLAGIDAIVLPGWREHDPRPGGPGVRPARAAARAAGRRAAGPRHLRRDDRAGASGSPRVPQPLLGGMDIVVRRNAFGRQARSFETPSTSRGGGGPGPRGVHPRALDRGDRAGCRDPRPARRPPRGCAPGRADGHGVPPRAVG